MPVRATWRDSDLGTSLYSAGAAPSRILFKRLFYARQVHHLLLLVLVIVLLVLLLLLGLLYCLY